MLVFRAKLWSTQVQSMLRSDEGSRMDGGGGGGGGAIMKWLVPCKNFGLMLRMTCDDQYDAKTLASSV